ncbi:MAG: hypothetical protein KF744_08625 [Taibaiella sp.]|nr:hypothetical protein [Taibaiella sp.]
MRMPVTIIAIIVIAFIVGTITPWWSVAVVAFLVGLLAGHKPGLGFLAGFLAVGLYWLCLALYRDAANEHILAGRMAALFHLPGSYTFAGVTAIIGALVGGLAAWAGSLLSTRKR